MFKDNKKRLLEILLLAVLAFFTACTNSSTLTPTDVEHETLIVASNGCIFNYNLDDSKIVWEYNSPIDSVGNRNFFVLDGQNIFIPFESGKFINFDINTGKIIWKQQIYGNEGILGMSSDEDTETEVLMSVMPLFMTKPLIDGQNIIMPSTGQPMQAETWLYNFNRTTGEKNWYSSLPTKFNFFTPVKYRNFYFVNSAGFLEKYNMKDGTATSYGMFEGGIKVEGELFHEYEENQFKHPIYNQMQTDGKNIYIGDEKGKFYAFYLNKTASLINGDISDPNNTFIKNPKVFKWTFNDETFDFQKNDITFLENGILYTEMKNGLASQSCLFALNTDNGKPKWTKILKGDVLNWGLKNNKITGYTENTIFHIGINGKDFKEIPIKSIPLSNIEWLDKAHMIYITKKGIEVFDTETQTSKVIFEKSFNDKNVHNNVQIKYIVK